MRRRLETPVGALGVEAVAAGVVRCGFRLAPGEHPAGDDSRAAAHHLAAACEALRAYFAGERRDFDDLALAPEGTAFQRRVWGALRRIPYGSTTSYGALARRIGAPRAARAVGAANGANPLAILQPCHRVVGSDGSLAGFAGGLQVKAWLLRHESGHVAPE
jgi:methylated-DNA-[protein]-cysteine S-methyltransferase